MGANILQLSGKSTKTLLLFHVDFSGAVPNISWIYKLLQNFTQSKIAHENPAIPRSSLLEQVRKTTTKETNQPRFTL